MYSSFKKILVSVAIVLGLISLSSSIVLLFSAAAGETSEKMITYEKHRMKWRDISKLISTMGYGDVLDGYMERQYQIAILRNADGTSIHVINRPAKKAIIINKDGSYHRLILPSYYTFLDNGGNIIAWSGKEENIATSVDATGKYFIANTAKRAGAIFAVANPDVPLAAVPIIAPDNVVLSLKGNKLYVFGHYKRNLRAPLKGFIYEVQNDRLKFIEEFIVPREHEAESPYYIEDISPDQSEMTLIDVHDMPSISKRYRFDLKTKKINYLGRVWNDKYLYLQCDVIQKVKEKLERKD